MLQDGPLSALLPPLIALLVDQLRGQPYVVGKIYGRSDVQRVHCVSTTESTVVLHKVHVYSLSLHDVPVPIVGFTRKQTIENNVTISKHRKHEAARVARSGGRFLTPIGETIVIV